MQDVTNSVPLGRENDLRPEPQALKSLPGGGQVHGPASVLGPFPVSTAHVGEGQGILSVLWRLSYQSDRFLCRDPTYLIKNGTIGEERSDGHWLTKL